MSPSSIQVGKSFVLVHSATDRPVAISAKGGALHLVYSGLHENVLSQKRHLLAQGGRTLHSCGAGAGIFIASADEKEVAVDLIVPSGS